MAKEVWEVRRDNLQALIDVFPDGPGNRAAFCRRYELDPLQIGQYFTKSKNGRNMGEEKAREIEQKVGTLRTGWLDETHESVTADVLNRNAPPAAEANDFLARMRKLQKEYDSLDPSVKKKVDAEITPKSKVLKLIKPKK